MIEMLHGHNFHICACAGCLKLWRKICKLAVNIKLTAHTSEWPSLWYKVLPLRQVGLLHPTTVPVP